MVSSMHIAVLITCICTMILPMRSAPFCPAFDVCHQLGNRVCLNGATCSYTRHNNCVVCICSPGWTGDKCDHAVITSTNATTTTAASDGEEVVDCKLSHVCEDMPYHVCKHGNCSYEPNNCAKCTCQDGWTGRRCDKEIVSSTTGVSPTHLPTFFTTPKMEQPDGKCGGYDVCTWAMNCSADGTQRIGCLPGWGTYARGCCVKCNKNCLDGQCMVLSGNRSGEYLMHCMCSNREIFVEGAGCRPICEVRPDDQLCTTGADSLTLFIVLGVVAGVALVLFFVFGFVLWIFWKRRNLFALKFVYFLSHFEDNDDLQYDAFLSYKSNGPGDVFVMRELFKKLEKDWGYRVVFHARDFIPGKLIADNILDAVKNSRRVILVLTHDFVESEWCQMEYLSAQQQMLKKKTRIIPLMMEDVTDHPQMDDNLQFILNHVTYLEVPGEDSKDERTRFWDRLRYSMPKKHADTSQDTEKQKCFPGLECFKRGSKQERYIVETDEVISRDNGHANANFSTQPNGEKAKLNMSDRRNKLPSSREPRSPYQDLPDDLGLVSNEVGDLPTPFPQLNIKFPSNLDDGDSGIEYSMTSPKESPASTITAGPFTQEIAV